jgi:glycosyltransferase involved in cell wall biosynthesis
MSTPRISACIPCFNNAATIARAMESIRAQSVPVAELFVLDDSSTDESCSIAEKIGARVIRHERNLGRGAVRARAMQEAAHEMVLSCDSANTLANDFCERALPWFESGNVSAVFGRISQGPDESVITRWRGRHLFKVDSTLPVNRHAALSTWGVLMRRSHVLSVGNFDAALRHSEDADLGGRLLGAGYEVVFDPELKVIAIERNTLGQVLERYWRWYAGKDERVTWKGYLKQIVYSVKVMALMDLRALDPVCVPISLVSPHYQFWRSFLRRRKRDL